MVVLFIIHVSTWGRHASAKGARRVGEVVVLVFIGREEGAALFITSWQLCMLNGNGYRGIPFYINLNKTENKKKTRTLKY